MLSINTQGTTTVITPSKHCQTFDEEHFNASFLIENGLVTAEKTGRATTYFFQYHQDTLVLRHYWRGGLIGKFLSDQYLYLGLQRTRTYQEFSLLVNLLDMDLPVPQPIAARVVQTGLIYRGDIITKALPNALSLLDILKLRTLSNEEIDLVASTLAQFHNLGVKHADLNINNILLSNGKAYLIDFDRGTLNSPSKTISNNNIERLQRSFNKEKLRNAEFHWHNNHWQQLIQTYQAKLNL